VAEERQKKRSEANGPLCGYRMCGYLFAYRSQLGKVTALGGFFEPEPEGDCLYLHDLAISPRFMGRRVAIRLVQHAWARAWDTGLRASALVAVQGSAPFWSRLGYTSQPALAAEQAARLETYEGEAHYLVKHFA
jgi:GNAT superfamily N-acetyltransferase